MHFSMVFINESGLAVMCGFGSISRFSDIVVLRFVRAYMKEISLCFRTIGQTSQTASTSSNAEDCRLTRLAANSSDSEVSESLGLSSNPVLYHTNGNMEGHLEEDEIQGTSDQDIIVNSTDNLTNNRKTKKSHEVIYIVVN